MRRIAPWLMFAACWGGEFPRADVAAVPWRPILEAPPGWVVTTATTPWDCPDDEPASVSVIVPVTGETTRAALILHDGAFDYVAVPGSEDPLLNASLQNPSRLDTAWAARQAAATAGTWIPSDATTDYSGALAVALAHRDTALVIPHNCWGDLYAGRGVSDIDGQPRWGAVVADWAWSEMALGAQGSLLPNTPDHLYLVGLGNSGRGVSTILLDDDATRPAGLLVDSVTDDLSMYFDERTRWPDVVIGLERIWDGGRTEAEQQAIAVAPLPESVVMIRSIDDSSVPDSGVLARAVQDVGGLVIDVDGDTHLPTASDLDLAERAANALFGDSADADTPSEPGSEDDGT